VDHIRLTQLDGKLPNLALMRLAGFHEARGDAVHFYRTPYRQLGEPNYSAVYGSAIFSFTSERLLRFLTEFPDAIVGGTGTRNTQTVEEMVGEGAPLSYQPWPKFTASLGFTQRGCRLSCKFCVVPGKEGKPTSVATIADIWRGEGHPKHLHLLDNDFFGQAEPEWRARIEEIRSGGFKVCFNQGINVRAITDDSAAALASVEYRDDQFGRRRLYTAWDNLKDEGMFFAGVDRLERAGVPPRNLMVFMLIGFAKGETMERIQYRFDRMVARDIKPYPMVYGDRPDLKKFQRWVVTGLYRAGIPFSEYDVSARRPETDKGQTDLFRSNR
jgi:hypothetical protein